MARGKTDYESMTVEELQDEAKRKGLSGTSHMRKAELIESIRGESEEHDRRGGGDREPQGSSKSLKYAQVVRSTDEEEERPGKTLVTRNHDVIRQWADERDAKPASIEGSRHGDHVGVLRFNFPGYGEDGNLEEISWDEWFRTFDERNLNFIYQEHKADGKQSNFFRLENPDREDA
jgi:hypothetical protein